MKDRMCVKAGCHRAAQVDVWCCEHYPSDTVITDKLYRGQIEPRCKRCDYPAVESGYCTQCYIRTHSSSDPMRILKMLSECVAIAFFVWLIATIFIGVLAR